LKSVIRLIAAAALMTVGAANAATTTIDFSGHQASSPIGATYSALGVTFSSDALFYQCGGGCPAPTPNGWFAYAGNDTFTITFSTPQTLVTFQGVSNSDTIASAYSASDVLVASVTDQQGAVSNVVDTLSSSTPFTSIVFSGEAPVATNLSFNISAVPEPANCAMMLFGLAAVGFAALRRKS
jgi:hypothetical protein